LQVSKVAGLKGHKLQVDIIAERFNQLGLRPET
jgi:hypothetical protein